MMNGELLTHRAGANKDILVLTLSNPSLRNALHPDMYAAGIEIFSSTAHSPDVRAVVITGANQFFCAGGNLNRLQTNRQKDPAIQLESIEMLCTWVEAIHSCPKPVIACVEGVAAGAGLALALVCDMVVAADDARFMAAYVRTALSPDGGVTWLLRRLLPRALAFEALMLGEPLTAERLHTLGVINHVTPKGSADAAALALAQRFASGPQGTQARIKRQFASAGELDLSAFLPIERQGFVDSLFSADAGEGIAAFLDKRAARFA